MQPLLPWILASLSLALLLAAGVLWLIRRRKKANTDLPTEWALTSRPVFSAEERRLYRQLREALPQQVVLSKLPLVRFCQPTDPQAVRYWYRLLGSNHVSFAICSPNGRVLAAIDVDADRNGARRATLIKQSVLAACRVRYLRCSPERMPSVPELQLLVPAGSAGVRAPQPASMSGSSRRERAPLWQDSGFIQDSFFGVDGRGDVGPHSVFGSARAGSIAEPGHVRGRPPSPEDVGGVVIDTPVSRLRH